MEPTEPIVGEPVGGGGREGQEGRAVHQLHHQQRHPGGAEDRTGQHGRVGPDPAAADPPVRLEVHRRPQPGPGLHGRQQVGHIFITPEKSIRNRNSSIWTNLDIQNSKF